MNAELWSRPDPTSQRNTLLCWFKDNCIDLSKIYSNINDISTEELRQLYIYYETHIWKI